MCKGYFLPHSFLVLFLQGGPCHTKLDLIQGSFILIPLNKPDLSISTKIVRSLLFIHSLWSYLSFSNIYMKMLLTKNIRCRIFIGYVLLFIMEIHIYWLITLCGVIFGRLEKADWHLYVWSFPLQKSTVKDKGFVFLNVYVSLIMSHRPLWRLYSSLTKASQLVPLQAVGMKACSPMDTWLMRLWLCTFTFSAQGQPAQEGKGSCTPLRCRPLWTMASFCRSVTFVSPLRLVPHSWTRNPYRTKLFSFFRRAKLFLELDEINLLS